MMKRILLLIIALGCIGSLYAQRPTTTYCSITGNHLASSASGYIGPVEVNYGKKTNRRQYLTDESGRRMNFNTMIEALNHMAQQGWRLESTYTLFEKSLIEDSGLDEINIVMILSKELSNENKEREQEE